MTGKFERMMMSDGADVEVYRATPEGARKGGLVLVQEIFGLTEHITDLCDGYAADGYEVLAPALYDREHPGFRADYSGEGFARAVELARQVHPFELSMKDVQSCIDTLKAAGPVFIVGYCYGGSVAWEAAATLDGLGGGFCLLRQHGADRVHRPCAQGPDDRPLRPLRPGHPDGGRRVLDRQGSTPMRRSISMKPGMASIRTGARITTSRVPTSLANGRWHCSRRTADRLRTGS